MTKPKRGKTQIPRRKPGLVIEPPTPRPMESDHPALHFFKANSGTPVPELKNEQPSASLSPSIASVSTPVPDSGTPVPEYRSQDADLIDPVPSSIVAYTGPTQNFYRKTNHLADQVDRSLTPAESKVLDHLVRLSIGFNKDTCQVRVTTLLKRTGYRSDKTVRAALAGLVLKGMIRRLSHHNNPLGDEYQILTTSGTGVPEYRSTPVKNTAVLESKITGHLNTLLKDNKNIDDESENDVSDPLAPMSEELRRAYKDLTGNEPGANEEQKVKELAQLLVAELREAATRTSQVSSPAAFLTAHLRRRLSEKAGTERKPKETSRVADADSASNELPASSPARLSANEIAEHTALLRDLIENGYTQEQATKQFADSFHPEDWKLIAADFSTDSMSAGKDQPTQPDAS